MERKKFCRRHSRTELLFTSAVSLYVVSIMALADARDRARDRACSFVVVGRRHMFDPGAHRLVMQLTRFNSRLLCSVRSRRSSVKIPTVAMLSLVMPLLYAGCSEEYYVAGVQRVNDRMHWSFAVAFHLSQVAVHYVKSTSGTRPGRK